MGTRVAEVAIAGREPRVVIADHLPGTAPILLHRITDLDETLAELATRGFKLEGESSFRSARARCSEAPEASG
jgi:hypothetical protein